MSTNESSPVDRSHPRRVQAYVLLAILSFLGNVAGEGLRYPEVGSAVLFPPYAVLTAALLAGPRRDWVGYILLASATHLATHWPQWGLSWVILSGVANVARALCAAFLLRRVYRGSARLSGIGALLRFILVAALIAPAVGATLGAANAVFHGAPQTFWLVWKAWFLSNALTGLTMLPGLALVFTSAVRGWGRRAHSALIEPVLLALVLAATCAIAFLPAVGDRWDRALLLYAPLPALIWAALRFGPTGASLALTVVAFAAIGAADRGSGPFQMASADEVLTLQMFVLATAFPVLCIAAVDGARRESHARALRLAGRLITAQEEERRRIARDLHDDLSQQVAAVSIALNTLGRRVPDEPAALRSELARIEGDAQNLADAVRGLSHEIHPAALEHAGLVPALRGICREVGSRYEMTLSLPEDLGPVPAATALCLYRAAQEALHNVAKHARARRVRVTMGREDGRLALCVADDGCGFDVTEVGRRGGLGLVSLEERVRLVGGRLTIASQRQQGTEIRIVVPLPGE